MSTNSYRKAGRIWRTATAGQRPRVLREEAEAARRIEYTLVVALIALAATAGMSTLASSISNAFGSVGTNLGTYTS